MKTIQSVLVVGAGAVGAVVASSIHRALPGTASLLVDAERATRLRSTGLVINGRRIDLPLSLAAPASGAAQDVRAADLIIVAVKQHQLAQAIVDMGPCVGKESIIISLLNGIASEDELASAFGGDKVLYAMILGIDAVREGGEIRHSARGVINFGEAKNPPGRRAERVERVAAFFDRAGVAYAIPEDMTRTLWYKLMINVGINPASAVMRATYGVFQRVPEARRVMDAAMRELIAIAKIMGTGLDEADVDSWYRTLAGLAPHGKTSMLQDVEAGRKTEIELFSGAVVRMGEATGVPTPVNRLLFDMVRAIELSYRNAEPPAVG